MKLNAVQKILGLLLMLFSLTMLPPALVSLFYEDGTATPFLKAFAALLGLGVLIWLPVCKRREELKLRDGFLVVVLFWSVLGLAGALPFVLSTHPHLSLTDAVFESISGLTTTGATVIVGLDNLPPAILYYRQQLQWLGGMGIIVLAVAVLPMLGIGGMQLYRAETPGPMKDNKLTPRITETAKALWYIYLGLTIACALAYWLAGMTPFDAIGHAFSTVAIPDPRRSVASQVQPRLEGRRAGAHGQELREHGGRGGRGGDRVGSPVQDRQPVSLSDQARLRGAGIRRAGGRVGIREQVAVGLPSGLLDKRGLEGQGGLDGQHLVVDFPRRRCLLGRDPVHGVAEVQDHEIADGEVLVLQHEKIGLPLHPLGLAACQEAVDGANLHGNTEAHGA